MVDDMMTPPLDISVNGINETTGEIINLQGENFYVIRNIDNMVHFFISVVSSSDHWLFISSNGGLSAGRISPETALFPYVTVDKIHESSGHTGSKTLIRIHIDGKEYEWEPFNMEHDGRFQINRHLYKNELGNKLCFEEVNHDLKLVFRYTWMTSDQFGFVRQSELQNLSDLSVDIDLVDGLQNILPSGTPRLLQTTSSNLVDAYKWTELDQQSGIACFTLYSGITDRAEPCESLRANTFFCLGLEGHKTLISSEQLDHFRLGEALHQEVNKRGIRGAYFINQTCSLAPKSLQKWQLVANIDQTQGEVIKLRQSLSDPHEVARNVALSIDEGSDALARIMASADGFQLSAEKNVGLHHYANVLFNTLRGGIFYDQYNINTKDFSATVAHFNQTVFKRNQKMLAELPEQLAFCELLSLVRQQDDNRFESLCYEYLPITFGRRHGDPSRPWNQFAIKLKDDNGNQLLSYQGNWRDIFQNWEALVQSYPEFIENIIAKFVNASTIDGYNPYRINKEGIDWEIEDPDDPWSYIGYWGDHQIIYLLKLLELSQQYHPDRLGELFRRPIFCYANVPYRIHSFEALIESSKNTVSYDEELAKLVEQRVSEIGADGKLLLDSEGAVYQVNLLEKLLVPLLSKLANLVIDGGIWLNTQRPEWNDANNALVGQGLSMVTLYYLRRYINFLQIQLAVDEKVVTLSKEVALWLDESMEALASVQRLLAGNGLTDPQRFDNLARLGQAASRYRENIYRQQSFSGKVERDMFSIRQLLDDALAAIDHSISSNRRTDNLYQAYNLIGFQQTGLEIRNLYPMLEGQVAALSSGAIKPEQAVALLEALFASDLYRQDQQSFMLYPDRKLPGFLDKNVISQDEIIAIPILLRILVDRNEIILLQDADGNYRFNADIINRGELDRRLHSLIDDYGDELSLALESIQALYENVFNHQEFTGRSGGMFGFEGLGCIYWHMVSKLLLATQEQFFSALEQQADNRVCNRLGQFYYRVRSGLGFNKSPQQYGSFPADPYSHTPKHAGARQPGMTGQVKEELITRLGELGIRIEAGAVSFQPVLLRARELSASIGEFKYLDVMGDWQALTVPESGLAFTWCQVPVIYQLGDKKPQLKIHWDDGGQQILDKLFLTAEYSKELFNRSGRIQRLTLVLNRDMLFGE